MFKIVLFLLVLVLISENEAARILAYYPTPSISHQVVFRPLSLELAKRGHEVVVITTDPMFTKKDAPPNLKEIDLHDFSYKIWREMLMKMRNKISRKDFGSLTQVIVSLIEQQLMSSEVQSLLKDKSQKFDLVIVEGMIEGTLGLAHFYKAPVIQFSSLAVGTKFLHNYGAAIHPFVYPTPFQEKFHNLTIWEKFNELHFEYQQLMADSSEIFDGMLKRVFGSEVPPFEELRANVDMMFLNVHSLWDSNRPVPPNVVYVGGIHHKEKKDLPEDLQKYLDSSKNGVIYVSFGTNVDPGMFPPEKIQALVNAFSKQPYNVIWKWNQDELPGRTENIKIGKWFPQADLLRHPKVKLFVTQGGLQSTDEAINAGVPLVGVPIFSDQNFNVEQSVRFGVGVKVDINTITEEDMTKAMNTVLGDDSYRKNVEKLRSILSDHPQPPLDRAVWWTEYVIRHKGAKHLRSPAANMPISQYLELELVAYVLGAIFLLSGAFVTSLYFVYLALFKRKTTKVDKKVKAKKN